jgi:predicted ATPase
LRKQLNSEQDFGHQIPKILKSIKFENHLKVALKLKYSSHIFKRYLESLLDSTTQNEFDIDIDIDIDIEYKIGKVNFGKHLFLENDLAKIHSLSENLDKKELNNIYESLIIIEKTKDKKLFSINLINEQNHQNELFNDEFMQFSESLKTLLKYDFLRISDLKLWKKDYGELSLRRASSGEQCAIIIMLGIAANIEDNSIILIDEPEVSLHPKWQEDFMPTLINTFSIYSDCQFIIATHSPQIVSGMKGKNCYVTDIASQTLYPASFFSGKSADFQLAEIFGSPGQMNEYLSRICFNLIFKIRNQKPLLENEIIDLKKLSKIKTTISDSDPIIALIETVEEMHKNASY